jgi:hypothetical protein
VRATGIGRTRCGGLPLLSDGGRPALRIRFIATAVLAPVLTVSGLEPVTTVVPAP